MFSFLGVLFLCPGYSQYSIQGRVVDEAQEPIAFAAVVLHSLDSTFIKGKNTDLTGKFSMDAQEGEYLLKIQFLAFKDKWQKVQVSNATNNIGNIVLVPNVEILDAVEITATKSLMELNLDKRVFNVGQNLNNKGGSASDVLQNVPSVNVDVEGNVSLRGSENVRILIDGKPSGLIGASSVDALRQMQGDLIERIEVITNPSARYDAEGEVGIINIVLKKDKRVGTNAGVEISLGYPANHQISGNINHRNPWSNVFLNFGLSTRDSPGTGFSNQNFKGDTSLNYLRYREHTRGGTGQNVRFGSDFFLNSHNTITLAVLGKLWNGQNDSKLRYIDLNEFGEQTQEISRISDESENRETLEFDLNYRKEFDKKGQEWTSSFKFNETNDKEITDIIESGALGISDIYQFSQNTEDEQNYLAQSDFVYPFGKKGKWETGVKTNQRIVENRFQVEELDSLGARQALPDYTNNFSYQENISAAYTMLGNNYGSFSIQLGLRFEHSDIRTALEKTNESQTRIYRNMFPSMHSSYVLDSLNTLQISYSKRISRPRFRHLLPFFGYNDSRNIFSGNPNIQPEFTHAFELGHLRFFEKGSILSSVYYRKSVGKIEWITDVDEDGISRRFPVNLSTQDAFGVEVNGNYDPNSKVRLTSAFNFYSAHTEGQYNTQKLESSTLSWTAKGTFQLKLPSNWEGQSSFNFRSREVTTQGIRKAMYHVDLGFSKDILNKKGTITFSGRDIFNTRKRRSIVETDNYYEESEFQWRSRQFTLSFSYRFNQDKKKGKSSNNFNEGGGE